MPKAELASLARPDFTLGVLLMNYAIAFALAFLWATVYRKTHTGVAYTRSFYVTLILIAPTVAMVMMAIGSNVALSLGLVGALSIIRFRTVIKDTKDMAFLFMSIAIGLTCGSNTWMVGAVGTGAVSLIALALAKMGHDRAGSGDYILMFRSSEKEPWNTLKPEAQSLISWRQLRGATDLNCGSDFEYTYSVRLAPSTTPERVISSLGNGTIRQVTMIAPENHLDL